MDEFKDDERDFSKINDLDTISEEISSHNMNNYCMNKWKDNNLSIVSENSNSPSKLCFH
jgi:hypothetical protein